MSPIVGDFGHHLQCFVGDCLPNSLVMRNLEIYQPLYWFGDTCSNDFDTRMDHNHDLRAGKSLF